MKLAHKALIIFSILLVLLVGALNCSAQEVKTSKMFTFVTKAEAIGSGVPTTLYVTVQGVHQTIYTGSKGGQYYVTQTKKGEYMRNYLPHPKPKQ